MRIAVVNQHPADVVGGSELQCDLVARGLTERGHDVLYVAVTRTGASGVPPDLPYQLVRVAPDPDAIVGACASVAADVVYWRMNRIGLPEVVDGLAGHGIPLALAVAHVDDVTRWPNRPLLATGTLRDRLHDLRTRIVERRSWRAFRRVAAVVSQRADLLGRVPVQDQRVVRNLMATDQATFTWPRPYVAWVGSLQPRKRPELLPGVADAVAHAGVDLLVAGEVRDPSAAVFVAEGTARPNLHHLGVLPQADVVGMLAAARAVVVTAKEEGFANVLIQAWWNGTPAVTLEHDPDGIVATQRLGASAYGDFEAFLAAVAELAAHPVPVAERERIRAYARATFGSVATLEALEAALEDVVCRMRPG